MVLLDCMDDVFPAHSAVEKSRVGMDDEMEEEARLFYVAGDPCAAQAGDSDCQLFCQHTGGALALCRTADPVKGIGHSRTAFGRTRLYPGLNIEHKNFGRGQVVGVDRERGTFTVFFGKNGTRTLTMQILKGDTVRKA